MEISQESPHLGRRFHSLFLLVVGPHVGSQSNDFIAHKTMSVQRIKQDTVRHHSIVAEYRFFFFWILFGLMNCSSFSSPVIGEVSYDVL